MEPGARRVRRLPLLQHLGAGNDRPRRPAVQARDDQEPQQRVEHQLHHGCVPTGRALAQGLALLGLRRLVQLGLGQSQHHRRHATRRPRERHHCHVQLPCWPIRIPLYE